MKKGLLNSTEEFEGNLGIRIWWRRSEIGRDRRGWVGVISTIII